MRVISGTAKGRKLKSVRGRSTRPTTDRVRESLFAILGSRVAGAVFLDLFAGTGAIGIEALSRGAVKAVFVEHDRRALSVIRQNLQTCGLVDSARVMGMDVYKAVRLLADEGEKFDLIFMDPPYDAKVVAPVLETLSERDLVSSYGMVICEQRRDAEVPEQVSGLLLSRVKIYGDTQLGFYSWAKTAGEGN